MGLVARMFAEEPYHGPLKGDKQAGLTPHNGCLSDEARRQMEIEATENLRRGFNTPVPERAMFAQRNT